MVLLFGPPGAGKSVQGQLMAAAHKWRWLSIGQVLRDLKDPEILHKMQTGELIDDKTVYKALSETLKLSHIETKLILDGFPRKIEQGMWLIEHLPKHGRSIAAAIVLLVPHEEIIDRLHLRARSDDKDDVIRRRITHYYEEIPPVLEFLQQNSVPVLKINGVGDVKDIHKNIEDQLSRVYHL